MHIITKLKYTNYVSFIDTFRKLVGLRFPFFVNWMSKDVLKYGKYTYNLYKICRKMVYLYSKV